MTAIAPTPPHAPAPAPACSVIILTLNERLNLAGCLESLAAFDDVHVLDSGSTDETAAIASRFGAKLSVNPFRSFGQQRNWGHDQLPLRYPWVLHLDADERMTPELESEIRDTIAADRGQHAGYYLAERTLLHGRWLRFSGEYPRYQARLVHTARMRFIDHGHGQREQGDLPFVPLRHPYDHHAFSHGIEHWLHKHVGYAIREAEAVQSEAATLIELFGKMLSGPAIGRRRAFKALLRYVPMRPLLRWLYVLVICRGVLDGRAGWHYARMMKVYQELIDLCTIDRQATQETR